MADLIAQGGETHQRWRRTLRVGEHFVLGREAGTWSVPWDERISRQHAQVFWHGGKLEISRMPNARNPIFVGGRDAPKFEIKPGEHFVIGQTTFTLVSDQISIPAEMPQPVEEKTFSSQYLRRIRFRNADHRIDVLTRLPDVISGAGDDSELFVRLVNMLMAGIPSASVVALVVLGESGLGSRDSGFGGASPSASPESRVPSPESRGTSMQVLHWDRRFSTGGDFQPSRRLIVQAITEGESVLHVWQAQDAANAPAFTMAENLDWAFCTPVQGEACSGWGVYVAGKFMGDQLPGMQGGEWESPDSDGDGPGDVREDVKFTELVAATLCSLRQLQSLQRTQTTLSQFFAPAVLDAMATRNPDVVLAPRETEVSVLFCDLRGFSLESERSADDLLGLLNRVSKALGVMTHHILDQGGVFGDFQGDAAMGFWGWPLAQEDKVQRACLAALAVRVEFEAASRRPDHLLSDFRMGIGLATGRAVAGRIGTTDQVKVTVFGPVVNLASRLEGMTKLLHAPILVDEATAKIVRERVPSTLARVRRVAVVQPYGLRTAVEVSELLPPESEYPDLTDEHIGYYEQALAAFMKGEWLDAMELLQRVPAKDRVKDFLTIFIASHNRTPPTNWNGVVPLSSKG